MENLNCGLFAMLIATHIGHTYWNWLDIAQNSSKQ